MRRVTASPRARGGKELFYGDGLSPVGFSDGLQEFSFVFRTECEPKPGLASQDGNDRALWEGDPIHVDLAADDSTSCDSHGRYGNPDARSA